MHRNNINENNHHQQQQQQVEDVQQTITKL